VIGTGIEGLPDLRLDQQGLGIDPEQMRRARDEAAERLRQAREEAQQRATEARQAYEEQMRREAERFGTVPVP
jgi:hypothetical protein